MSERAEPVDGPDHGETAEPGRRGSDLDPAALLEQARADRRRRLATAATVAVASLVVVTVIVVLVAISGVGSPPMELTLVLGLCWLFVLVKPPSIAWRT